MTRLLFLATLLLALFSASSAARAQGKVCDGRFERFLQGYKITMSEMGDIYTENFRTRCRATLDLSQPQHQLIDAALEAAREYKDTTASRAKFAAACANGARLGCLLALDEKAMLGTPDERREGRARLRALLDTGYPAVAIVLATNLVQDYADPAAAAAAAAEAESLLHAAADKGDYWATFHLFEIEMQRNPPVKGDPPPPLLVRAAEQGYTPAATMLALYFRSLEQYPQALDWYRRAAAADTRWFRFDIGQARFNLGWVYAKGELVPRDLAEARRWYQAALDVGFRRAQKEIEQLPKQ